jgi:DnaJ-class molecular chaperone
MPRGFAQLNYYEMLDIKPNAVAFEIRHAYNAAVQIYQPDSLVSYSFFSDEERRDVLSLIEKAYSTLIDVQARKDYNEYLIRRGDFHVSAIEETVPTGKRPVCIFDINRSPAGRHVLTANETLKSRISQSQCIGDVLSQNEICGADLKKIRMELNVLIEQIAQETKIRIDHLRSIEEDHVDRLPAAVFIKGFVKSYLKCLYLEPIEEISARYMDNVARLSQKQKAGGV